MKLKDYPQVAKAYQFILDDSAGVTAGKVSTEQDVPEERVEHFQILERVLTAANNRTVKDTLPEDMLKHYEFIDGDELQEENSAWMQIVIPTEDLDIELMIALGLTEEEADYARGVLFDYFDGELATQFE